MDKIDNAHRVDELLQGIPKKAWKDGILCFNFRRNFLIFQLLFLDPFLTVIGTMPNIRFIKYLIKTLALQIDFAKYGRVQIFAIMHPRDFIVS